MGNRTDNRFCYSLTYAQKQLNANDTLVQYKTITALYIIHIKTQELDKKENHSYASLNSIIGLKTLDSAQKNTILLFF